MVSVLVCLTFFSQVAEANVLISPYYRHLFPQKHVVDQNRVVDTITYHNERITLFTRDHSHQFGVQAEALNNKNQQTKSMIIQTIDRRPITARSSIFDDGLIFQYWEMHSVAAPFTVVFGYTTDRKVQHVTLKFAHDLKELELHDGQYFFCVLNPVTDQLVEAQGIGTDGKVLRRWNGQWDYHPRRTWLSVFVQSYPFVVT